MAAIAAKRTVGAVGRMTDKGRFLSFANVKVRPTPAVHVAKKLGSGMTGVKPEQTQRRHKRREEVYKAAAEKFVTHRQMKS